MERRRRRRPGRRCLLAAAIAAAALAAPVPLTAAPGSSSITAVSFVAVDGASGRVLLSRADSVRRPIASLTKVMTALLVAEQGDLQKRVLVTPAATEVEPEKEGLVAGRSYRRITLL